MVLQERRYFVVRVRNQTMVRNPQQLILRMERKLRRNVTSVVENLVVVVVVVAIVVVAERIDVKTGRRIEKVKTRRRRRQRRERASSQRNRLLHNRRNLSRRRKSSRMHLPRWVFLIVTVTDESRMMLLYDDVSFF